MAKIEDLQSKIESLSKKQLDIESQIQRNQAKKEVLLKQLKDEYGIEQSEITTELTKLQSELEAEKTKLEETVKKFEEYLKKIGEKLG